METNLNAVPYLDNYFGWWAIDEASFWSQYHWLNGANVRLHLAGPLPAQAADGVETKPHIEGQIGLIDISGKLMKQASSMGGGTSTVAVRRAVRAAKRDPEISAVMLRIDSPGGTVAGTQDLADDIAALAKTKPVMAYIEDLGASAAYWLASQADMISTSPSSLVGSIGTFAAVYDTSGMAAREGIKAYVIRAGKFKGAGMPGTEITAEQLAEMQRTVDALNEHFLAGVASGRRMPLDKVREIADGRTHVGADAKAMGLVDYVESFDAAFARLQARASKSQQRRTSTMAEFVKPEAAETSAIVATVATLTQSPQAASYAQIVAGCIGADAPFICEQLAANATLPEAQTRWMARQNQKIAEAQQVAELAKAGKPGVQPIAATVASNQTEESATARFRSLVDARIAAGMDKARATAAVVAAEPELHRAMVEEANAGRSRRR